MNNAFTAQVALLLVTSSGSACEHSSLLMGRASGMVIIKLMGKYLVKFPLTRLILEDRRFYRDVLHYPFQHFSKGHHQFTSVEVTADRNKCEARYTPEMVFLAVTDLTALQDVKCKSSMQFPTFWLFRCEAKANSVQNAKKSQ